MEGTRVTGGNSVVICSVIEPDAARALKRIESVPPGCGLVELRADHLVAAEVEAVVRRSGRPMMVTIRRQVDGGAYTGPEAERRRTLVAALDAGARWVDVEWDSGLRDLAEGQASGRVVLSHHGGPCAREPLSKAIDRLSSTSAAKIKLVPHAESIRDLVAIREVLEVQDGQRRLTCFAMGRDGALSRLLAPSWGSWATYGRPAGGASTAGGQFAVDELLDLYRVDGIDASTRLFGLIGTRISSSPSPAMHAAGYAAAGIDARFLPLEFDGFEAFAGLPESLGFEAFGVTLPYKREAASRCVTRDALAEASLAVNTVLIRADGWHGFNTDGPAVVEAISRRFDPAGARVSILGAGGTACAIGAALQQAGGIVRLFNRDPARGAEAAKRLSVESGTLEDWPGENWTIVVNATPLGRDGETVLAVERLAGRAVVDVVYGPGTTPLVRDARRRGLVTVDGFEMLLAQAVLQFGLMTGLEADGSAMERAGRDALSRVRRRVE